MQYNAYRRRRQDSDKLVLAYQLLSRILWLYLRYYRFKTFVNYRAVFVFGDFLLILLGKN